MENILGPQPKLFSQAIVNMAPRTRSQTGRSRLSKPVQSGSMTRVVKGKGYSRTTTQPSRLSVSRRRYTKNKAIGNYLNNIAENVFKGYEENCLQPVPIPATTAAPIGCHFINLGSDLSALYSDFITSQDAFTFPVGTGTGERQGNYMYIKKSHMKMEVQLLPNVVGPDSETAQALNQNLEFRLVIVKANRKYNKIGETPNPGTSLFLQPDNSAFGYATNGLSTQKYMKQPINRRQWIVYKDTKFILSPPASEYDADVAGTISTMNASHFKYPIKKHFTFDFNIYKKTHFENVNNTPDNVDTQWLMILLAAPANYCQGGLSPPRNYTLSFLGTTSAMDM